MTTPPNAPEVDVLAVIDRYVEDRADSVISGKSAGAGPLNMAARRVLAAEAIAARTAVAALLTREAALVAERDKDRACLQMIYKELQHIAPWSESNDMETVDEIMCGLGLLAQDRDALAAEVGALREGRPYLLSC